MSGRRLASVLAICTVALLPGACGPAIDLKQALQVTDLSSGWYDAGVQNGQNKLVPSVRFKLRKNGDVNLSSLSLNLTFTFSGEQERADDVFVQNVAFEGAETAPIIVRTKWGHTADPPQTRAEMLTNSHFRDIEVQIFAKRSSGQWTELQRLKIARRLVTE